MKQNSTWMVMIVVLSLLGNVAVAQTTFENCIMQPVQAERLSSVPVAIAGLDPLVSRPVESNLKLHTATSDCCSMWQSPTGDFTVSAGPYDPISQRLYLWGYYQNGWIEVDNTTSGTWVIGEGSTIEPKLYSLPDDIEDVTEIKRSAVLGSLFYSGFTAPHWLTGNQSYRVYELRGTEMLRIYELENSAVRYIGDDPNTGLAAFGPLQESWMSSPELLVWYDGVEIVIPNADFSPPREWCH